MSTNINNRLTKLEQTEQVEVNRPGVWSSFWRNLSIAYGNGAPTEPNPTNLAERIKAAFVQVFGSKGGKE
jgi:hypothetical protein